MRQKLKMAWQWHRCSADKQSLQLLWNARAFNNITNRKFPCSVYPTCSPCCFLRTYLVERRVRTLCLMPHNVKENSSAEAGSWDEHTKPLHKRELMALLADPPGAKLAQELSEANQQNQFLQQQLMALLADYSRAVELNQKLDEVNQHNQILKQQLHEGDDVFISIIRLLAFWERHIEDELQDSRTESGEIYISPRKKKQVSYIAPRLLSSLAEKVKKVREAILGETQLRKVTVTWFGEALHVYVMGSFNGWSDEMVELLPEDTDLSDEELSEDTDSGITFSTTLMLRPGRYEIIFMVDNVYEVSPELPVVGDGEAPNNLLVVE